MYEVGKSILNLMLLISTVWIIYRVLGTFFEKSEYSVRIMQLFRTFSAGHPEIRCSDSGCQCSPL